METSIAKRNAEAFAPQCKTDDVTYMKQSDGNQTMISPYRPYYLSFYYRVLLALPTYGTIGQYTDPPSPCLVFEHLAKASHPNTRHAEDPIA